MRLPEEELILYLRELSLMLDAGFSMRQSLEELSHAKKPFDKFFQDIYLVLNMGKKLSVALKYYKNFDKKERALIEMGEENAKLSWSIMAVAELKNKERQNKAKIKKALFYPLIVLISLAFAFIFLLLFVVPKFKELFLSLDAKLPTITIILIKLEEFFSSNLSPLIISIFLLFFSFKFLLLKNRSFKIFCDKLILKIPLVGKLVAYSDKYYYFLVLSLLLKSGLNIVASLDLAANCFKNSFLFEKTRFVSSRLFSGLELDIILKQTGIFESFATQMLALGLKTGRLAELCEKSALYYEEKEEYLRARFLGLLEPIASFFVALLVLFLALGIFMPMWELSSVSSF